jgi:hypothetical protein
MRWLRLSACVLAAAAGAMCAQVDLPDGDKSVLPSDYKATWVEVRDCESSIEHAPFYVRVRTAPDLADVYRSGPYPFPTGALIVKEQYRDARCVQLDGYTAMKRQGDGWRWYSLDMNGRVRDPGNVARCQSCHADCGKGRDGTCALAASP